jgi:DNA-binding CsgD family transcriptional regulator
VLVGRESELSLLAERIAERRAFAVLGEAGVGKTTLVRAAAEGAGKRLVEAGALATLSWLSYLPLRRAFGHDFEGDAAFVGATVEAELGDAVLFVDDLQWADAQTASLLLLLVGRIPLVVAVRRGDPGTPAALEATAAAGTELLPLGPLPEAEAAELARALHPELSETATKRLVERSGGNPFLLEQLAATGEPNDSIRLTLAARLRVLTPAGRDAIAALTLLGRPAEPRLLGVGAAEIVAAGLATANGEVAIRHALLAEAATEMLGEEERRAVHARLAAALDDPGEAARHHAAAGERSEAFAKAMLAAERADRVGERASHLRIAASCASGTEADRLRLRAAHLLCDVLDTDGVEAILDEIGPAGRLVHAEACLIRSHVYWLTSRMEALRAAVDEGLALAGGSGTGVEVALVVARARTPNVFGDGPHDALANAEAALRLAQKRGCYEPLAQFAVGNAMQWLGHAGWLQHLSEAWEHARLEGDLATEWRAANNIIYFQLVNGEVGQARSVAEDMVERMRTQKLAGLERRFRGWLVALDWHGGMPQRASAAAEEILDGILDDSDRRFVEFYLCQALADLGRHDDAQRLADEMVREVHGRGAADTYYEEICEALWCRTDAVYWSGRAHDALAAADAYFDNRGDQGSVEGSTAFVSLTRAWARLELELDPGEPVLGRVPPIAEAAPIELEAIALLAAGGNRVASERFDRAADLWRGRHFRGELRCRWASGEAIRRAGQVDRAVERLTAAERLALERGYVPLLAHIRRSLRLAGLPRASERRGTAGGLTARERETLELVAAGLSNAEIARRLGLGRPTVVRLIRSAQQKLGANSRTQAAALASRR